jgi:hypothetical protein
MACPICRNKDAVEDLSFGGGKRFHCVPCGGFFRISTILDALSEGKLFDVDRARDRLDRQRNSKKRQPNDPNSLQYLEPILSVEDHGLLIESDGPSQQ